MSRTGTLHFDGSANPNPGNNCRCGYVLRSGTDVERGSIFIGKGTNNTAEYLGLIHGLKAALSAGISTLEVFGDSRLVINGVLKGPKRNGKPHLEALKAQALALVAKFQSISFNWIPREENDDADAMTMDQGKPAWSRYDHDMQHLKACAMGAAG